MKKKFVTTVFILISYSCNGTLENIVDTQNNKLKTNWEIINVDMLEIGLFGKVKSIKQTSYGSTDSVNWSSKSIEFSYEFYEDGKLKATISEGYKKKYLYKYDNIGNWISLSLLNLNDSIISSIAIKYLEQKAYWGEDEFILDGMGRISVRKSYGGNVRLITSFVYEAQETLPLYIRTETITNGVLDNLSTDSLFYNKDHQIIKKVNVVVNDNKDTTVNISEYTFGNNKETLSEQRYATGLLATTLFVYNYIEFDNKGNWIKRIRTFGTPKYYTIQERQIAYF